MTAYCGERNEMVGYVPPGARRVLDVGCGNGSFGRELRSRRPGLSLWAVEPDGDGVAAARGSGAYERVVLGGYPGVIGELPGGYFDCVFFNDVLEHLVEPGQALAATRSLLAPRGRVVASIPNVRCLDVVKPLVVSGDWRYEDYGLLDRTHLRFFTRSSMCRLFDEHGYEVASVEGIHRKSGRAIGLLDAVLGRRLDEFLFQQFVVVGLVAGTPVDHR